MNVLIPWEIRIKEIESHFGSVVASYFTFLRWLFGVNLVTGVVLIVFVAVPEILMANTKKAGLRKKLLKDEQDNATNLFTLWDFEGVLKYSPLFYGYYSNQDPEDHTFAKSIGYTMPLAYFLTELAVYIYSFVAILRRMADNSRQSKLSEKDDECVFTWKLFTGWDYMIGNAETAHNRTASIILGFKEALLEEAEKRRDEGRNWKVTGLRVFTHINVLWLLGSSVYAVVLVVDRSTQPEAEHGWWRQNESTIVVSLITAVFPTIFEVLGIIEKYHPRKKLRMQLARIMALNLLNLYTLIFASFSKINEMSKTLQSLRPANISLGSTPPPTSPPQASTAATEVLITIGWVTTAASVLATINSTSPPLSPLSTSIFPFSNDLNKTNSTIMAATNFESENLTEDYFSPNSFSNLDNSDFNTTSETVNDQQALSEKLLFYEEKENSLFKENNTNEVLNINENSDETMNDPYTPPEGNPDVTQLIHSTATTSEQMCTETVCDNPPSGVSTASDDYKFEGSTIFSTQTTSKLTSDSDVQIYPDLTHYIDTLDLDTCKKLRPLCWETMFGREMVKLTVMDLVMTVFSTIMVDFLRAVFVRYMNNCWCWDLEKKFPQYGDFKMAENILHLVNNQGMVWMGMFFAPGLPMINIIKLAIMMYLRSWAVLTCNVPHEVVFRASRSNNFYLALLLTMLFLCVLPVGYAVVWVVPSWHCGPFSNYHRIYHIFTKSLKQALPYKSLHKAFDYIASPGIVIPLLMLLILIIYYLISLTNALREANTDLKVQLRRERTEERRKMFQLVDKKRQEADNSNFKWRKVLPNIPPGKLTMGDIPIDVLKAAATTISDETMDDKQHIDILEEFMKKAKRLPSGTSEEENALLDAGDGTDLEQHDSLPYDVSKIPLAAELPIITGKAERKIGADEISTKKQNKKRSGREIQSLHKVNAESVKSGIPEIRIIQTETGDITDDDDNHAEDRENGNCKFSVLKKHKPRVSKNIDHTHESDLKTQKNDYKTEKHGRHAEGYVVNELESNISHRKKNTSKQSVLKHKSESNQVYTSQDVLHSEVNPRLDNEQRSKSQSKLRETQKLNKDVRTKKAKLDCENTTSNIKQEHRNNRKIRNKPHGSTNKSMSRLKTEEVESNKDSSEEKNMNDTDGDSEDSDGVELESENDYILDENDGNNDDDDIDNCSDNGFDQLELDSCVHRKTVNVSIKNYKSQNKNHKKKHSKNKIQQNYSEKSESSQNTEQVEKPEKVDDEHIHTHKMEYQEASSSKPTKEQKNTTKALARFKIAKVLLKEARRRSNTGLEEV